MRPKKDAQKVLLSMLSVPFSSQVLNRKKMVDLIEDASKRPRTESAPSETSSLALTHLGALASSYVKDEQIKEWQSMSLEKSTKANIRASAKLLFHSTHSVEKIIGGRALLTRRMKILFSKGN